MNIPNWKWRYGLSDYVNVIKEMINSELQWNLFFCINYHEAAGRVLMVT